MASGKSLGALATAVLLGTMSVAAFGQTTPPPGPGGNPPANNGGRQRFDPAQFRQRMMDRLKEELGASDDEMAALSPKLTKVMDAQRNMGSGRGGMFRRGGGPGGTGGGAAPAAPSADAPPPSPVQQKATDLKTALDNKESKPEDIKAKLDALREAKAKAKEELTAAQQELRGLLTQRQEAVLVMAGMLD